MAKQVTKKEWTEPELIVLVRSKPEECVLAVCKHELVTGENENNGSCLLTFDVACPYCADPTSS